MKNLKLLLPGAAAICCLAFTNTAHAQDAYWPLANDYRFSTSTGLGTVISNPEPGLSFSGDADVVFDDNGYILFTGGPNSYGFSLSVGQVFPIPGICKNYYSLTDVSVAVPHGNQVDLVQIDASAVTGDPLTTGTPSTVGGTTLFSQGGGANYSVVATRLNADYTRYIYHLNNDPGGMVLYRYTIGADGSTSTSTTTIGSGYPQGSLELTSSQDGQSLGYFDNSGELVTIDISTGGYTTYSSTSFTAPSGTTPGIVQATTTLGERRWYVSSNSKMGYFVEGNSTSWNLISTTKGTNSSLAMGKNKAIYLAYNAAGVSAGPGKLHTLSTATGVINEVFDPNALISALDYYGTSYQFGNHVEGEDICAATSTSLPISFQVAGISSTATTSSDIWLCNGTNTLLLTDVIAGYHNGYTIKVEKGNFSGGVFSPTSSVTATSSATTNADTYDLFSILSGHVAYLAGYYSYIRVTVSAVGGGCSSSNSVQEVFRLNSATASVGFYMIGPISTSTSNPACDYNGVSGAQETWQSTSFSTVSQPVDPTNPPCSSGWVGAGSVGISKVFLANNTLPTLPNISSYDVTVDEYTSTGIFVQNILSKNPNTIATTGYPFNGKTNASLPGLMSFYFASNYSTIKNNNYYKVTVTANTDACGAISQYSYFKILDGGVAGSGMRLAGTTGIQVQQTHIYPNPATDNVHVAWYSQEEQNENASIFIVNTLGQVMLKKELPQAQGNNDISIDVSAFAPGFYHYILKTTGGESKGTLSKL